tara:strand:+ start:339 stop:737 length:399 start_codon:yes stop_codon:yes gene_type:complete
LPVFSPEERKAMTEVRELKAKDLKTVAKMLGKLKASNVAEIFKSAETASPMQTGVALFQILAADVTDEIYEWLADLAGLTVEELDELPAATPVDIVKELVSRGDWKSFLASLGTTPKDSTPSSPAMAGQTAK